MGRRVGSGASGKREAWRFVWSSRHAWRLFSPPKETFWEPAVADFLDPALLFNGTVHYRGAMTLEALREKNGDLAFFQLLRDWATQNRYGNVTTPQFIALAEQKSEMDLTAFFGAWIFQEAKPTTW
jgi:aminopeptidase N